MHTATVHIAPVDATLPDRATLARLRRCPRCRGITFVSDELLRGTAEFTVYDAGQVWSAYTDLDYGTQTTIAVTCAGCGWRAAVTGSQDAMTRDGVTVTITRSAGADQATVVQLDTTHDPDDSEHGLRVYLNDHALYTGVAYQPPTEP